MIVVGKSMGVYGKMYQASVLLEELLAKHGPSEFGRVCQLLLGLTLKELGFEVPYCQLSGRPDVVAMKGPKGYRIEAKAYTGFEVTIDDKDLEGVNDASGYQPVIAVLSYPEVETKWIMADARYLHAGRFDKTSLEERSIKLLEREVNKKFGSVVEKYHNEAIKGSRSLKRAFNSIE